MNASTCDEFGLRGPDASIADGQGRDISLLVGVLDELDYGVILLDEQGRMILGNDAAHALLERATVFALVDGRPLPLDVGQRRRWRALLDGCSANERRLDLFVCAAETLSVAMVPMSAALASRCGATRIATFGRQRTCEPISLNSFARAYGLSATETKVLASLSAGQAPTDIAIEHRVSISTVRTQIKQVLAKTASGNMREVLSQMSRLAPVRTKHWHS